MAQIVLAETASAGIATPSAAKVALHADTTANPQLCFKDDGGNLRVLADGNNTLTMANKTFTAPVLGAATGTSVAATSFVTCSQLGNTVQTSATTTGAITLTLTSGSNIYLSGALTGTVTFNITVPQVGSRSMICFQQGATAQTVTLSMASVVFRQSGTTGTGTGTYNLQNISTVNGFYRVAMIWMTATLCYLEVG
jgi:hypothetical protein